MIITNMVIFEKSEKSENLKSHQKGFFAKKRFSSLKRNTSMSLSSRRRNRGNSGGGVWVVSPKTNRPIKTVLKSGEDNPKYQKLARDYPEIENRPRFDDIDDAYAEARRLKASGEYVPEKKEGKQRVAWFNTATMRVVLKQPGFKPGSNSTLKYRSTGATEDEAKLNARKAAYEDGLLKTNPAGASKPQDANAMWVKAGKVNKQTGEKTYIKVGGPAWKTIMEYGSESAKADLRAMPQMSTAEKKQMSRERSRRAAAARRTGRSESATQRRNRINRVRATRGEFVLCVKNPNTGRTIGVERGDGTTTGSARVIARDIGSLEDATSKSGGAYRVSDARVVQEIRRLIGAGRLEETTEAKKCR